MNVQAQEEKVIVSCPQVNKSDIANMNPQMKEEYVKALRLYYPEMNKALSLLKDCKDSWKSAEPVCGCILGPTRVGKTEIAKEFLLKYPEYVENDQVIKPVFYTSVPSSAHIGPLVSNLLYDLKDPFWNKSYKNYTVPTNRLCELLKICKVELIIIEEVQQIVDRDRKKLIMESADWFKDLYNRTGIPIVFIGLEEASKIFEENEQLSGRVVYRQTLRYFSYEDKAFRAFLQVFDNNLPFERRSGLAQNDMWKRIYVATEGRMGRLKSLLYKATRFAADYNQQAIDIRFLAHAYNSVLHEFGPNPFVPGFDLEVAINRVTNKRNKR